MLKYQNLMALASVSVASLMAGCAATTGMNPPIRIWPVINRKPNGRIYRGTASKIERQVLLQKKYIPATEGHHSRRKSQTTQHGRKCRL